MSTVSEPGVQRGDSDELAQFGYKQELDRSLGSFSSFAAGFSYISICLLYTSPSPRDS